MANNKSNMYFTSPKGTGQYVWLNTPDIAFNQNAYKVQLKVPADDAKGFIDQMKAIANDNFGAKAKDVDMPYDVDKETGEVILKFKSKYKPKFCDVSGQVVTDEPRVGGGSVLKIKGNFYPYESARTGVSMQMSAVQIIELVEHGGGQQFEAEEGSYQAAAGGNGEGYDF